MLIKSLKFSGTCENTTYPITQVKSAIVKKFCGFGSILILLLNSVSSFFLLYKTVCACVLSHGQLFATPWTVVHHPPLSMKFSKQEYWSGLPFSYSRGSFQPRDQTCIPCIAGRFFIAEPPGKPFNKNGLLLLLFSC